MEHCNFTKLSNIRIRGKLRKIEIHELFRVGYDTFWSNTFNLTEIRTNGGLSRRLNMSRRIFKSLKNIQLTLVQ